MRNIQGLIALTAILLLAGCGTAPTTDGGASVQQSAQVDDSTQADAGSLECDETSQVDEAVCDDLNEAIDESSTGACDLADGSAVWTPAFGDFNPDRPVRCAVSGEAEFFAALAGYGGQIDGVADMGTEGAADYNVFYLVRGGCSGEPAYWPATESWSRYKGTSPSLTDERFATGAEVVAAICAG